MKLMYMSGTSVSAPMVAGAAALMLEANPNLTPNMVKMIMMYTAQPLSGFNTFEQGAGQLNIAGSVAVAKLVRNELLGLTPSLGSALLTTTAPSPKTTISTYAFPWAQGLVLNHGTVTGNKSAHEISEELWQRLPARRRRDRNHVFAKLEHDHVDQQSVARELRDEERRYFAIWRRSLLPHRIVAGRRDYDH